MLKGWIRLDARTNFVQISGKLSEREQEQFRRYDTQKGEYEFVYSPRTGRTTIILVEHPEWTGNFSRGGEKRCCRRSDC